MKKFAVSCLALLFVAGVAGNIFAADEHKYFRAVMGGSSVFSQEIAEAVFNNSGNYTFFKKQGTSSGDVEDRDGLTMWVKGFYGDGKVDFNDINKINTTYYGGIIGVDTDRKYGRCFDATYGIFGSYTNGEFKNDNNNGKVVEEGGYLGIRANWYVGKLFIGALADYGYRRSTIKGGGFREEDFDSQNIGVAAKAGYNFELSDRSFTVQPNVLVSGDMIIAESYNFAGQKVESDDFYSYAVAPGLKLAKNFGKCWIVTAEGKYVITGSEGNVELNDNLKANTYYPDYASAGLGVEKIWGYTVLHAKVNKTFAGRDEIIVNAGMEFKF